MQIEYLKFEILSQSESNKLEIIYTCILHWVTGFWNWFNLDEKVHSLCGMERLVRVIWSQPRSPDRLHPVPKKSMQNGKTERTAFTVQTECMYGKRMNTIRI